MKRPRRTLIGLAWMLVSVAVAASAPNNPGTIYLGGNRITGPYELQYYAGRLAVNGFLVPPQSAIPSSQPSRTPEITAEIALSQHLVDTADSLQKAGYQPDSVAAALRSLCELSPLVDSVTVGTVAPHWFIWHLRSGATRGLQLNGSQLNAARARAPSRADPANLEKSELHQIRALLDMGATIFLIDPGSRMVVPQTKAAHYDSLASQLRSGVQLPKDEERKLPAALLEQLRHPVRLEKIERRSN